MTLVISYRFNKSNLQIDFFSEGKSDNPAVNAAIVTLSRGRYKPYRLDDLQAHNGTGATWDGIGIHSDEALGAYIARCLGDIDAAIEAAMTSPHKSGQTVEVATIP